MRIGVLLLVGLGFVFAAACTSSTSADSVCQSQGGTCLAAPDGAALPAHCGSEVSSGVCDDGYVCCLIAATVAPPSDAAPVSTGASTSSAAVGDAGTKG